ncbi:hypothetical protein EXN22_24450 [Pseudomonas tructae]|uniref:Uncharacterized protein n=1 Tax=Pseudomonas tructae TaxID=2518644 RepID=A0A411MPB9_9PSED|nr:hypothetical protein EXN22_24450 [Pseudomonas tructae]
MHDTYTRGGLVHRRRHKPRPVGQLGDAVEEDIARAVPVFSNSTELIFILLIYKNFIFHIVNFNFSPPHNQQHFYIPWDTYLSFELNRHEQAQRRHRLSRHHP